MFNTRERQITGQMGDAHANVIFICFHLISKFIMYYRECSDCFHDIVLNLSMIVCVPVKVLQCVLTRPVLYHQSVLIKIEWTCATLCIVVSYAYCFCILPAFCVYTELCNVQQFQPPPTNATPSPLSFKILGLKYLLAD